MSRVGQAAAKPASAVTQAAGANGTVLRNGDRVQRRSDHDYMWYVGTVDKLFNDGDVAVALDSGEYWQGEGEDVHPLPPDHPGQESAMEMGLPSPDGLGTQSPVQEYRPRKESRARLSSQGASMTIDSPMAADITFAAPHGSVMAEMPASVGVHSGGSAPFQPALGGFVVRSTSSPAPPAGAGGPPFSFGAGAPAGGFTFGAEG